MTREQNFRSSFIPQLETFASWQNISRTHVSKIPLSEFPSFAFDLGKSKYTQFDMTGRAIAGEQEFTITAYYTYPLRENEHAYTAHSNIINLLEQFMNDPVYIPPAVFPGETYRIDRCKLIEAKEPVVGTLDTRYVAGFTAKYLFTMF